MGIISIIAIIIQAYFAKISLKRRLPNRNHNNHDNANLYVSYLYYFYSKCLYVLTVIFEYVLKTPISCSLDLENQARCESAKVAETTLLYMVLFFVEAYLAYIVYVYYKKHVENDIIWRDAINNVRDLQDMRNHINSNNSETLIEANGFKIDEKDTQDLNIEDIIESKLIISKNYSTNDKLNKKFSNSKMKHNNQNAHNVEYIDLFQILDHQNVANEQQLDQDNHHILSLNLNISLNINMQTNPYKINEENNPMA